MMLVVKSGLVKALTVLGWVVVLLFVVTYASSLFTTNIIGKSCKEGEWFEGMEACDQLYGTMGKSMYTLVEVITLDMAPVREAVKVQPLTMLFFIMFLYLTSFGLLNIVMGVLVEQTIEAAAETNEKAEREKAKQQRVECEMLKEIFASA